MKKNITRHWGGSFGRPEVYKEGTGGSGTARETFPARRTVPMAGRKKNIVLVGFMGTGKSSLGRALARRLNYRFIDTDLAIEKITGLTVEMIFRRHGVIRFRSEENLLAKRLLGKTGLVIATGGGMLLNRENITLLSDNGVLIGLRADPEVIINRLKNKKRRPLLKKGNVRETVLRLLQEREGIYDAAEFTVDTGKLTFEASLNEIIKYLKEKGHLR